MSQGMIDWRCNILAYSPRGRVLLDVKGRKVVLVGHYGSGNYGDDMMLQALIDEYSGSAELVTVVFFNDQTFGIDLKGGRSVLIKRDNKLRMLSEWAKILWVNDLVIWGGGTCFTDEEGDGFFLGMMVAKFFRRDFAYRSVGIGNLVRLSRKAKAYLLLRLCSYVSFREKASIAASVKLLGYKSKYCVCEEDLGERYLKGLSLDSLSVSESVPYIVVAWRDLSAYQGGHQIDQLLEFLRGLIEGFSNRVVILDVDNLVDAEINNVLESRLKEQAGLNVLRSKGLSFSAKNSLVANAAVVVTARLHIGVAAINFSVPVYIYPYSPKISYAFSDCSADFHILDFSPHLDV